jgi:hypothetical protein
VFQVSPPSPPPPMRIFFPPFCDIENLGEKIPKNYFKFGLALDNNSRGTKKNPNNIEKIPKFPKFLIFRKTKFVERNPKTSKSLQNFLNF